MYELEQLEMEGMGEADGFEFEANGEYEDGEQEDQFLGDIIGGLFEDEALESLEADPFIGDLIKKASSVLSPAIRAGAGNLVKNLAKQAATVAGGAIAGPTGARIAGKIANQCIREAESEYEYEDESEYEDEAEGLDHQAYDEMNYYAAMAAEAETEAEADNFLGAILPILGQVAGPLLGGLMGDGEQEDQFLGDIIGGLFEEESEYEDEGDQFLPALLPLAMPLIKKGVGAVGKMLVKNKGTRAAARALPKIAAKTLKSVTQQARRGQRPTPQRVASHLARHTAKTLASRPKLATAMRQNRVAAGRAQARPQPRPGSAQRVRPGGLRPQGSVSRPSSGIGVRPRPSGVSGTTRSYQPGIATGGPVYGTAYGTHRRRAPVIGYVRIPVYGSRRSSH